MSKKLTQSDQTHTLSTRLSAEQKDVLEQAASACDMTTAKFLRIAAMKHASDVLNAQEPNDAAIRELARALAEKLTNVKATVYAHGRYEEQPLLKKTITASDGSFGADQMREWGFDPEDYTELERVEIDMLTGQDLRELQQILARTPSSFAEALVQELRGPRKGRVRFAPIDIDTSDTDD